MGKEAYEMADQINKDAEELNKIMADRNAGMTYVLIGIAVLLGVAVFGNLYATIKNPNGGAPPPRAKMLVQTRPTSMIWNDEALSKFYSKENFWGSKKSFKKQI